MLTEARVRTATPRARPFFLWDTRIPGFGVKINPKGPATYVLQYRVDGKSRRVTLAPCAELSLREARHMAATEIVAVQHGTAPTARQDHDVPTVADLWHQFESEYVGNRILNGRMTASTVKMYRLLAAKHLLPALGETPVADVTRTDVQAMVEPLAGRAQHNRVLALVSRLFTLAEHWELRPQRTNPARGIERAREEPRDRVLSPLELIRLADALTEIAPTRPAAVAAIRVAAVTGLRIGEVLAMRWEHVAFDTGRLTLPATKTGRRVHDLPSPALRILEDVSRLAQASWVFDAGGAPLRYDSVFRVFRQVRKKAGLEDVRMHDLRRTVMTNAAMSGVGTHVLRDLLGHKTTAMADRYIRAMGNPVRDAREQVGAAMAAMMEGRGV